MTTCYTTYDFVSIGVHPITLGAMTTGLGDYLKNERMKRSWTQVQLADMAGVPKQTINRLENGKTNLPGPQIRRQIAEALGVPHIELLVAAGEITADEAGIPDDPRSEAERRLSPLIAEIGDDDIVFRAAEAGLRSGIDLGKKIRSGSI